MTHEAPPRNISQRANPYGATMLTKTFIIDRSKWLRGEGGQRSYLLRASDRRMCCIGQICKQRGIAPKHLKDSGGVYSLLMKNVAVDAIPELLDESKSGAAFWVKEAYRINDDKLDDPTREAKLTALFAANGFTLQFIN